MANMGTSKIFLIKDPLKDVPFLVLYSFSLSPCEIQNHNYLNSGFSFNIHGTEDPLVACLWFICRILDGHSGIRWCYFWVI